MKRRNFFAFVPSLFAVPLVAKEIIQEKEAITIIKPEPVKIGKPSLTTFDMSRCKVQLVYDDGRVIGEGYLTNMQIDSPLNVSVRDSDGYSEFIGPRTIEVSAQLYNFHL